MDVNSFIVGYTKGKQSASGGGGGAELNIHYSETEPPEDTSKLWVKCEKPNNVQIVQAIPDGSKVTTLTKKLPEVIQGARAACVGDKVYLFGGYTSKVRDSILEFDTKTQEIRTLDEKLPTPMQGFALSVIGRKVYLFGGNTGNQNLSTILEFDVDTHDVNTLFAALPALNQGLASAVVGTQVYLFGGYNGSHVKKVTIFDAETKAVSSLGNKLEVASMDIDAVASGTRIYLFGGSYNAEDIPRLDNIFVFDTESLRLLNWFETLPTCISGLRSGVIGQKIYLFGGNTANGRVDTINVFDTVTQGIETLNETLPTQSNNFAIATVGQKVYMFGGTTASGRLDTINVFHLSFQLDNNNLVVLENPSANTVSLLPNVEIGVQSVYKGNESNEAEPIEAAIYKDGEWKNI